MANNTVGFVYQDGSFFNADVTDIQLQRLSGEHGDWYAPILAGDMALKNNFKASEDCENYLAQVVVGGYKAVPSKKVVNVVKQSEPAKLEDKNHWTNGEVLLLIELYRGHRMDFQTSRKKLDVWKSIAEEMEGRGYKKDALVCEKKFSNLKQRYKSITDHNQRTGRDLKTWTYFDKMDALFGKDPTILPPLTLSSLGETKECTSSSNSTNRQLIMSPRAQPKRTLEDNEEISNVKKRKTFKTDNKSQSTAPSWFLEWSEKSTSIMEGILEETRRKNDLLEKLIEKL